MTELNNNEDQIFQHHEMIQEVLQTEKYQENKNEEKLVTLKARPRSENKAKCLKNTSMKVKKKNFLFTWSFISAQHLLEVQPMLIISSWSTGLEQLDKNGHMLMLMSLFCVDQAMLW